MADSKVVTLILTQAFIMLGIIIAGLTVYVFYLKHKIENRSAAAPQEEELNSRSANHSQENDKHASDAKGNDAWKLKNFFDEEILSNEQIYQSLSGSKIPQEIDGADENTDSKLLAIIIRHLYLKAELEALVHRNDPGPFWDILAPILLKLSAIHPSERVKKKIINLKNQLSIAEKENKRLNLIEETFFKLQKLLRDCLPENIRHLLLPLTEEIELLNTTSSTDEIIAHYKNALALLQNQKPEKESSETSDSSSNTDLYSLNQIAEDQAANISVLEEFLTELHEQSTLPTAQLNKYHNFIISLKEQLKNTNDFVSGLDRKLGEAEMCTNLLESELEAAQETIRSLMADIEESGDAEKVKDLEQLVSRFTNESRDMLMSIQMLQDENTELRNKIDNSAA